MSNSYFNGGSVPAPNAPGASQAVRAEFSAVAAGFDKLPVLDGTTAGKIVAVNGAGNGLETVTSIGNFTLTNPTVTGGTFSSPALIGTPTAPTASAGTSTTQIATTQFVQSVAFQAVLPAQAGNAGKYIYTDGSVASWQAVPLPQIFRVARTSNTVLTAADRTILLDVTSGTFTQTFDPAATLGNGWFCYIRNSGTGVVTLSGMNTEVWNSQFYLIQCDGANLRAIALDYGAPSRPPTSTLVPNRLNIVDGGTYTMPFPLVGQELSFARTQVLSPAGNTNIVSPDGWTYVSAISSASTYSPVNTGTKRPWFSAFPSIPSQSLSTSGMSTTLRSSSVTATRTVLTYADSWRAVINNSTGAITVSSSGTPTPSQSYQFTFLDEATGKAVYFADDGLDLVVYVLASNLATVLTTQIAFTGVTANGQVLRLTDTRFVYVGPATTRVVDINWSTNAVTLGAENTDLNNGNWCLRKVTDTAFIAARVPGTPTFAQFRYCTISGTTITANTAVTTAATDNVSNSFELYELVAGSKWVFACQNSTTTHANFYGVSLSGSTITLTAKQQVNNISPIFTREFFDYSVSNIQKIDSDRLLHASSTSMFVIQFASGTLTIGSLVTITNSAGILQQYDDRSQLYVRYASGWSKIAITGTVPSIDFTVTSAQPRIIFTANTTNLEYRGSTGVWYSWASSGLENVAAYPVSSSKCFVPGLTSRCYTEITI